MSRSYFSIIKGVLQGPLRLSSRVPSQFREGGRAYYPAIHLNDPEANLSEPFPSNAMFSTKYTLWSFLPKLLFEQFRKVTSIYFLLICVLASIPQISPFNPLTSWLGLLFILVVSGVREAYEDYLRLKADIAVNNTLYTTISKGVMVDTPSYAIKVGDFVYLKSDERIPVDMVLIASSREEGSAYIETSQLDGETNLKVRKVASDTYHKLLTEMPEISSSTGLNQQIKDKLSILSHLSGELQVSSPSRHLYLFRGSLMIDGEVNDGGINLSESNLLLASSRVKNTDWILGICVYTGPETKVGLNQRLPPSKFSTVDSRLNKYILTVFFIVVVICCILSILNTIFLSGSTAKKQSLMTESDSLFLAGLKDFWTYFALLNYLIPLSLVVSLDIVRFIQSSFIQWDVEMDCNGQCSSANTSNLNEELALVDYVLSDKTGTLTENIMNFKKASINGIVREGDFPELIQRPIDETTKYFTTHFLYAISLAHSCQIIESHDKKMVKSPSPDEEALCSAAEESGFILKKRTPKQITLEVFGQMEVFEILLEMPFTPERRRMFVIVKGPDDKIVLYTKGADTAITELMDMQDGKNVQRLQATQMDTKGFAHQGYRTLFIAMKEISEKEFMSYASEFENISPNSKEAEVLFSKLSSGLTLIGSTAIEDRLQPGVAATVTSLRMAGIRIWMITGDNLETAVTIGYASNLISSEMEVVRLDGSLNTWGVLHNTLKAFVTNNPEQRQFALVLDGNTLDFILSNYRADFVSVARYAACTICSRVTPSQKADVVSLLQNNLSVVCLAIGDGGNDVSMLQQAQVGVGILGREGNQASRAADFAVPQFRCLGRLLLIHGRYSLLRNTKLIYQFFYKNLCSFMPSVWFAFVSGASGVTPFDPWSMLFYNTIYTALPYLSLGLFEKDLDEEIVMKNPRVYRDHKKLESRPLFHWMSNAVFHSLIIFFGCWAIFQDKSFYENGLMPDIDTFGSVLLFTSFHVVLFKYLLETSYWVSWTLFSFFVSLLVFYILQIIISLYVSSLSNAFVMMLSSGTVWLWLILAIPTCLIGDVTFKYLRREIYPKATHILQERSQRSDKKTRTQDSKSIPLLNIFPPGNESYERL